MYLSPLVKALPFGKIQIYLVFRSLIRTFAPMIPQKKRLLGLTPTELKAVVGSLGMPAFTARQMAQWLYEKHVKSIDEMTNISKQNRERLSAEYEVGALAPIDCQRSKDGTIKYLFPVETANSQKPKAIRNATLCTFRSENTQLFVETVFIPDKDRATLCVSCQVGCKMNCLFCQTGKQGWQGDLTPADILNQIYALPEVDRLTNIVFMGQGEPMDNLDAVLKVCDIMTADWGWLWSPKRITVSSVGVKNKLKRFLDESDCHVAISMHSPLHEQRLQLMPAEKAMPIEETIALLKQYDFTHQRRCSFEYICFGGLNDSPMYGREIVKLLEGLECRVNLIRFHEIPNVDLPASDESRMEALRDYLTHHGITTTIRASRGQDIFAACGLLSTAKQQETIK